jgi:hypothetical protein
MKLSVRGLGAAFGLLWGGAMLTSGLINLAAPRYGRAFLKQMSSLYPGFHNSRTLADVLVGAGYGAVDGAVAGAALAALYNSFTPHSPTRRIVSERGAPVAAENRA